VFSLSFCFLESLCVRKACQKVQITGTIAQIEIVTEEDDDVQDLEGETA
jgi:hypothetical protein